MMRSRSYFAIPPGTTIKEQLDYRGMTQKEFASHMDMSETYTIRLINGEVKLTSDIAHKLETVLGLPANFWQNLETIYREKLAKAKIENMIDTRKSEKRRFHTRNYRKISGYRRRKNLKNV